MFRAGEMAHRSSTLTALAKDLSLVPNAHISWLQKIGHLHAYAHSFTQAHRYTSLKKINLKKFNIHRFIHSFVYLGVSGPLR